VATGLLLLKLLGRRHLLGHLLERAGIEIVFTWRAVVIALMVMSFPFLVRGSRVAFEEVDVRMEQMARTLGASEWRVFLTITLPLAARGITGGIVLAFLFAGNIPGRTTTLAIAIYDRVELGHDSDAYQLLAVAVVIAFVAIWTSETMLRRRRVVR